MSKAPQEHPPAIVLIAGSAGSFQAVCSLLSSLPGQLPVAVVVCIHRLKDVRHGFAESVMSRSGRQAAEPVDKEVVRSGRIYLAPANYHLYIDTGRTFSLSTEEAVNHSRPSIDLLFQSAARVYGHSMTAILLSGANQDGAIGVKAVAAVGGTVYIQDPHECEVGTMPRAAAALLGSEYVMRLAAIQAALNRTLGKRP